jgi:NADPH:quinone reductase-like Zn-dependent oxidoreductase
VPVPSLARGSESKERYDLRAVRFQRYGPPEVLRIEDVPQPAPKEDEVLVRVHATTASRSDSGRRSAEYFIGRFFMGVLRPRQGTIGLELAGEVESAGAAATELAVGDRVFGIGSGTNAEYVCVREGGLIARMPDGLPFEQAAAVADGALSAMSLLRTAGLREGQRIAVYGASGSIGVGCVQLAKNVGAHVTAVCRAKDADLMRSLGADEVVDYTTQDFAKSGEKYDVVLDAAGKSSFLRCRRALKSDGIYVTTDPGFLWHDAVVSLFAKRAKLGIVRYTKPDLQTIAELLEAGKYRAVIDRTYPLEDVVDAHRYVDTHQKTGNVVLTVR